MLLIAEQHSFLMYSAVTRLIFSLSIQAGHELLFLIPAGIPFIPAGNLRILAGIPFIPAGNLRIPVGILLIRNPLQIILLPAVRTIQYLPALSAY